MRILARYLSGIFIKNFLISALGLTGLYIFQALLGRLVSGKFPATQVLFYHSLEIPDAFVLVTPPAILIATVLTLATLSRTNELVACYSVGVGLRQLMVILMLIVFIVCCLLLFLQDRVLPPVYKKRTTYYYRVMKNRQDFFLDFRKDKIWYRSKNLIYNLKTFDPSKNRIFGMAVYTFDEAFHLIQVVSAEEADYTPRGWMLHQGIVTVFEGQDQFPITKKFDQKELIIRETPEDFQEIEKEVDSLRVMELKDYIDRTAESGVDTKNYEVKFHHRISQSFIPLVMCLLAVPFSTRRRREGGLAKNLSICLGITFFYWFFNAIGLSLGENGALPPIVAAWMASITFGLIAVGLLVYRQE